MVFKKVLMMGPSKGGKTSMRNIIFAHYLPRDVVRLGQTIEMDQTNVKFLGNLVLNLWDCGGQMKYIDNYLKDQRDLIFSDVGVMIYVFDINALSKEALGEEDTGQWTKAAVMDYFKTCAKHLHEFSPNATLFCILNKIDLVNQDLRETVFEYRREEISKHVPKGLETTFFKTSIWDDSLNTAWSTIVNSLVPNISLVNKQLEKLAIGCGAVEVAVFESSTFLCITRYGAEENGSKTPPNTTRVSNIVKHFKQACLRAENDLSKVCQFQSLKMTTAQFTAIVDKFTEHTFVMIVCKEPAVDVELHRINLQVCRHEFHQLLASPAAASMREVL